MVTGCDENDGTQWLEITYVNSHYRKSKKTFKPQYFIAYCTVKSKF